MNKPMVKISHKYAAASRVLKLMDSDEDGQDRYGEFVAQVAKEKQIAVGQLEAELTPFI